MTTTTLIPHLTDFSLENMRQQPNTFFLELTGIIQKYKDKSLNDKNFCKSVDECVMAHKGIKVETEIHVGMANAYVQTAMFDQAHVFWPQYYQNFEEFRKLMKRPIDGSNGWIDTVNGKVGGIFSEYVTPMVLMSGIMKYEAAEVAAIVLHELGHIYTFMYYTGHIMMSNLVIIGTVREALKIKEIDKRTKILKQATEYLKIEDMIPAGDLATSPAFENETATETILVNAYRERHKSATGNDLYDLMSCEQLADQFAVRHGAGKALTSALVKVSGMAQYGKSKTMVMIATIFKMIVEVLAIVGTYGFLGVISLICNMGAVGGDIYDSDPYRIRLIKQTMIDRLRHYKASPEVMKAVIEDLDFVADIEKKIPKEHYGLVFRLTYVLSKKKRDSFAAREFQKSIEELLQNDLFVTTAKLQNMGA